MTNSLELPRNQNEITHFLQAGRQTQADGVIQQLASGIRGTVDEKIQMILSHGKRLQSRSFDNNLFRKRTGAQVIKDGFITGCTDAALAFITIARASGLSTKYLETIDDKWLRQGGSLIEGHVYAEVYDADSNLWVMVDPWEAKANIPFPHDRVLFKAGLDSWDVGITDFNSLRRQFESFKKTWIPKEDSN